MPREGWLERQRRNTAKNVYEWPEWMRREAGIPNPEKNAINDLRTELARVRAAARALYYAAHWKADRPVNETALWEELRDACGFELGNAPKRAALEGRK